MHPYSHHKQNAVGKRRANKFVHGNEYARGGKIEDSARTTGSGDRYAGDVVDKSKEFSATTKSNRYENAGGFRPGTPSAPVIPITPTPTPKARGGKVKHDDEAQDRKLIKQMIKQEEKKEGRASGGKIQDRILPGTYADRGAILPIFPINPQPPPASNTNKEKK